MNPQRSYQLLVILHEAGEIQEIVKKAIKQVRGADVDAERSSNIVIEPILPGCDCWPPKDVATSPDAHFEANFWVVPQVLGKVNGARIVIRRGSTTLAEIPLDIRVVKQTLAVVFGVLGLASPYITSGSKTPKVDPSQKIESFSLYREFSSWFLDHLTPETIGLCLLAIAGVCYLMARPRERDMFWDVRMR